MWCSRFRLTQQLTKIFFCSLNSTRTCYVDTIDEFTMHLVKVKSKKWEALRIALHENHKENVSMVDIDCPKQQLEEMVHKTMSDVDADLLRSLLKQNCEQELQPTYECLERIAMWSARSGNKDILDLALKIAKDNYVVHLHCDSNWEHFEAALTWKRGDIVGALKKLEKLFAENKYLRRKLRFIIRYLLLTIIADRGEAALLAAIESCKRLNVQHNEWYLLACTWQVCFSSEWYSDQCISYKLIEEYPIIHHHVRNRLPSLVRSATRHNQPELLHRLIEFLLKYRHIHEKYIPIVAQVLFNYKFRNSDFSSCAEILRWAQEENITLSPLLHQKILSIYLDGIDNGDLHTGIRKPKVKFKF